MDGSTQPQVNDGDGVSGMERDAAKEIEALRKTAEKLRGNKDVVTLINEANASKAAADQLRKHLPTQGAATQRAAVCSTPQTKCRTRSPWLLRTLTAGEQGPDDLRG